MKPNLITPAAYLAIIFLFLTTFGLAALNKWIPLGIPDGFISDFGSTWMGTLPGGLFMAYYTIAITETLAVVFFSLSLFKLEFLPQKSKRWLLTGLLFSLFIFVILAYGLRLIGNFGGTANTFFYFGATLLSLWYVQQTSRPEEQA